MPHRMAHTMITIARYYLFTSLWNVCEGSFILIDIGMVHIVLRRTVPRVTLKRHGDVIEPMCVCRRKTELYDKRV